MRRLTIVGCALLAIAPFSVMSAAQKAVTRNTVTDPATVTVETADAERFAALFKRIQGHPTAAQLQADYLDKGSPGIAVFTPERIVDAGHLAQAVAAHPDRYLHAIEVCLPAAKAATADLRAIYAAYRRLLPDVVLPAVYVVFGAGNSGGTAVPGAQVIGLESACEGVARSEDLRPDLRALFGHETVHTLQPPAPESQRHDMLAWALREGGADFIAGLVTGDPDARDAWGTPQEKVLWHQFEADRATLLAHWPADGRPDDEGRAAALRWFRNHGSPPRGWPSEAGYWIGKRIAAAYYARAADKRKALREIIAMADPERLLAESGYVQGLH
jgi:hypothetical protein